MKALSEVFIYLLNLSLSVIRRQWGKLAGADGEAAIRGPQLANGHPKSLAPQQLRRAQRHQAVHQCVARSVGAHRLRQRTLLHSKQVSEEESYLTVTNTLCQMLFLPESGFSKNSGIV